MKYRHGYETKTTRYEYRTQQTEKKQDTET